jgi:hypothetical protein
MLDDSADQFNQSKYQFPEVAADQIRVEIDPGREGFGDLGNLRQERLSHLGIELGHCYTKE